MSVDRGRKLSLVERAVLSATGVVGDLFMGYTVGFAEELVRQHGLGGLVKFSRATLGVLEDLIRALGESDAHLLSAFASFWNGCEYCTYGHVLAHNLHWYHETQRLFPLDEQDVTALMRRSDDEVAAELRRLLAQPEHASKLARLEALARVRAGEVAQPPTAEQQLMLRCLAMYDWVNECSIVADAPSPPLGPIAKDKDLRRRYDEARRAERAAR